jgi:hypothetical protein
MIFLWHHRFMANLDAAAREYREAVAGVETAKATARRVVAEAQQTLATKRTSLAVALADEARRGTRMRDLVAKTGLSREWIRVTLRNQGVESDR